MTSPKVIGAAIILFVIAAALWFQANATHTEGFVNLPVAGRPYGAVGELADENTRVPADLNKAPVINPIPNNQVPTSDQRPTGIPGAPNAPREALATRKDLIELDNKITAWLAAANQLETAHPGGLTPEQRQRRVMLQARLGDIRQQLGTSVITDTYKSVAQEILTVRHENSGWGRALPSLEAVHSFGKHAASQDAFLTSDQFREFTGLFHAILNDYQGHTQPNPLERVRLQQLQVIDQDLRREPPPPIRIATARLFLEQAQKPDQPLPTLFAVVPGFQGASASDMTHAARPDDIIRQLQDMQWRLTVTYDPAGQALKRSVATMLQRLQVEGLAMPAPEMEAARTAVARLQSRVDAYEPADIVGHAQTLCKQMTEAFGPADARALGCPTEPITTYTGAETTTSLVCERLRTSVPSVDPRQFNCPTHHTQ
jgi:hypothetical protein